MSVALPYLPAGVEPASIRMVAVCEALTESGDDFLSAPRDSMFVSNLVPAFRSAGADIVSVEEIVDLGVYLTVAVKAPKVTSAISAASINEHAGLLAAELDALANVRVVVLMGDVAIKAMNAVTRQRRQGRAIPPGSTYKLRHGEYRYGDVRVLPSYLPTGKSYLIERSKREMIAEDLRLALGLIAAQRPTTKSASASSRRGSTGVWTDGARSLSARSGSERRARPPVCRRAESGRAKFRRGDTPRVA